MGLYAKKPEAVEAVQFKGGLDSARDVIEWLCARGFPASYLPEILNDGSVVEAEQLLIKPHRGSSSQTSIFEDNWAYLDGGFNLSFASNKTFTAQYVEVEDAD